MPRGLAMCHPGRKLTKQSLRPPVKGSLGTLVKETDYSALKRTQLQQQCKKLGLRATGKTVELVERLKSYHGQPALKMESGVAAATNSTEKCCQSHQASRIVPPLDMMKDVKTGPSEKKTDDVLGWCVVHGMALYRPKSSWAPLLLRGGVVCVQDGENLIPFLLPPLNIPVPDDLSDNHVCEDCVLRNREKPKRCLLCHQIQGKGNQTTSTQKFLKVETPCELSASQPLFPSTGASNDRRRTIEIKKLYQPQEDQAYAQRVDGILSRMARGELGMDRALRPLQPLVVHSPAPFDR
ncbi:uncharacterized protein LOC128330049 [Hemicordylus capensis]|uniref:uncharacterized protein LOC128330049 n=1 Tax=Hemicordylus capensis TaxID=884348 RepID=UPI002304415E|nr:uncharacterized protein LOC128330049 [Hemicordylus capensis]